MREYLTPDGFRAAVESRLRERGRRLGVPAYLLRRQAAIERLLVRLWKVAPGRWAIKGGIGLETRLGAHARVSLDLDADHIRGAQAARSDLQRAATEDLGDHFAFALVASEPLVSGPDRLAIRYSLDASLSGRSFEPVQVDVTIAPPSSGIRNLANVLAYSVNSGWARSRSRWCRWSARWPRSCTPTPEPTRAAAPRGREISLTYS